MSRAGNSRHGLLAVLMLCCLALPASKALAAESALHEPSGQEAWIPPAGATFTEYVSRNEERIRAVLAQSYYALNSEPFGPGYPLERVVQMRAPYELLPDPQRCGQGAGQPGAGLGFLLIHGLTDSPYLLRGMSASLTERYPCAIVRGLLLPGHGTQPGDSLEMRHEDWLRVTEFGVDSFRGQVEALYMVGFSTGTSLSVRYVDEHRDDTLVRGLIMLSPALAARSSSAYLAPYLRWFSDWLGAEAEHDAARYESFSVNAGAEFYLLTRELTRAEFEPLPVPVFMAGSGDDTTVNIEAAREFFCSKTPVGPSRMLWYSATATGSDPVASCPGLQVLPAEAPEQRVYSLSHTSISVPPEDPHYGFDGAYSICLHYGDGTPNFNSCVNDDAQTVYGERNLGSEGRFEGKLIRRGSFNPHYAVMFDAIACFIDGDC